ncbi:hypothetical protein KVA01_13240 [Kocuria varians]|uniref:Uncharacterized protein n=1 Tax=Kocuria varians TaxID=1272 RepID=A0A4Y4D5B8_KOCVA|nr:hypothetical protein [Kocuria varians]GEC99169.1 hypothetical protein KVA01_13240 [Kocuria varians]
MSDERPAPPHTGLDPVDRVLAREAEIALLPVTERSAAYEALHAQLERVLEERPGALPTGLTGGPASGTSQAEERPGNALAGAWATTPEGGEPSGHHASSRPGAFGAER